MNKLSVYYGFCPVFLLWGKNRGYSMSSYVLYLSSALFDTRFLTLYFCRQIKSSLMEVFSIIIPVYNRPEEIDDLLNSLTRQTYVHFEVIVVDDGSSIPCESIVNAYNDRLRIRYFYIENSGPGLARNQGVRYAEGEIVIVLDSDCIVPASYLEQVHESLMRYKVDAFGGADRAHSSFSAIQKAVNYSMTSFFTTGGIRGSRRHLDTFYPRSFNMGMRKEVYEALGGFSDMRYGEDIDFSIRILRQAINAVIFRALGSIISEEQISSSFPASMAFGVR